MDTPDRGTDMYGYHFSPSSRRHHHNHNHHHPYRRSEYFPNEFNKVNLLTFDGEMESKDVVAWLLGMKKFFRLHNYSENMKAKIDTFSIKGKANIWWEDVKNAKGIWEEDLIWDEFERLFNKKYLSKRYYDDKAKEFYELQMGSMTEDEYTSRFLEISRCVPYVKDDKEKIQRFINGFPATYRDWIEFDEPWSLEEAIRKLNHCYEKSKHKVEPKSELKGNDKVKGKWPSKWGRP